MKTVPFDARFCNEETFLQQCQFVETYVIIATCIYINMIIVNRS